MWDLNLTTYRRSFPYKRKLPLTAATKRKTFAAKRYIIRGYRALLLRRFHWTERHLSTLRVGYRPGTSRLEMKTMQDEEK